MYGRFPVPVGAGYRNGYLARPDKAGRYPTVILSPGLGGMTSAEKSLARALSRRGVAVVVLDLYPNRPTSPDAALRAYAGVGDGEALRAIEETVRFLSSPDVDWSHPQRLGLLGVDVGGRLSLIAATRRDWAGAVALISTPLIGDESREYPVSDLLNHIGFPVLGLYGAADPLIDTTTVDEAQDRNPSGSWLLYEGVGHGFYDAAAPDYDPAAAVDATNRLASFFAQTLPPPETPDLG